MEFILQSYSDRNAIHQFVLQLIIAERFPNFLTAYDDDITA
jgi:hypothetical protein